jgi:hypothetical protein
VGFKYLKPLSTTKPQLNHTADYGAVAGAEICCNASYCNTRKARWQGTFGAVLQRCSRKADFKLLGQLLKK